MSLEGSDLPPPFPLSANKFSGDDDKKERFIGEKYAKYYKEKFDQITPKKQMAGFHIAAFFLGPIWLFYRKMYAYGAIYIAFIMAFSMVTTIFEMSQSIDRAISIGLSVTMGLGANSLYKYFVEKRIQTITENYPNNFNDVLVEKGGTSPIAAWGLFILLVILIYFSI